MGNSSINQNKKYGTDICDGRFKIRKNQGITQAMADELGLSKKDCKSINKSVWNEIEGYIKEQNDRNIKNGRKLLYKNDINMVSEGNEIIFDKDIWGKITKTVDENTKNRMILRQNAKSGTATIPQQITSANAPKTKTQKTQKIQSKQAVQTDTPVLTEEEAKKKKRKKIITGIAIGATIALAAGLLIADIRRPNSIVKGLFKRTKLGKDIKEGLDFAKEAHDVPMEKLAKDEGGFIQNLLNRFKSTGKETVEKIAEDENFINETFGYAKGQIKNNGLLVQELKDAHITGREALLEQIKRIKPEEFKELNPETQKQLITELQKAIELSGTGPTKIAQVLQGEPEIIKKIEGMCPPLAEAMKSTKSGCSFSRTFEEASQFLEESFKGQGYVLEKELGAASIGATYDAIAPDGTKVVVKMLKQGVNKESLQAEEEIIGKIIDKFGSSAEEIEELKKTTGGLYKDWIQELDLFSSMKNSEKLADGAQRFSVAKILKVSENGQCLIMEKARGIKADKLIEKLKEYKQNPSEFFKNNAELIKEHPWLGNPEKVIKELPNTLLKSFDEQFFFIKKGGNGIMHGDPHTGNFFITINKKGKLIPEFIDTDNCVIRSAKQIRDDISFVSNYFIGNSKKVAEYFVNQCECGTKDKKALIEAVSGDLKALVFDKKCNLNNAGTMLDNVKTILKNHGLKMSTENATAMKAQLQNLSNVWEASALSGGKLDIFTMVKDVPKALWSMIKAHVNPFSCIKDALKFATHNVKTSVGCAYQFLIRDSKQVV